jgi:DNA-binding IclR family transcriptional regulator
MFCTAPGRAMLAWLDEGEARAILQTSRLEARTAHTKTDLQEIMQSLAETRSKGYCLTNQEAFVGDISVSSPVFNAHGAVVAAVNIAVPWPRWQLARVESELAPVVAEAARMVTLALNR